MTGLLKKTVLGTALAASTLAAVAPAAADAQRYRGGYRYNRGGISPGGAAVLGGILGLGVGAAIASSNRDRYYDRGYYADGYYYDRRPRVVYRDRYYAPPRVIYRDRRFRDRYYGDRYYDGYPRGGYRDGYYRY